MVGDWNGDGKDTIGVFNPWDASWYLKNSNTQGAPDIGPFQYGGSHWRPVVGDWNADGKDSIGVFQPGSGNWYVKNVSFPGAPDINPFPYGAPSWTPVFFDGNGPTLDYHAHFRRLLRPHGVLISTNLDFGGEATRYRKQLSDPSLWVTSFAAEDGRTAISIKV